MEVTPRRATGCQAQLEIVSGITTSQHEGGGDALDWDRCAPAPPCRFVSGVEADVSAYRLRARHRPAQVLMNLFLGKSPSCYTESVEHGS
jgi:hypothetical protein